MSEIQIQERVDILKKYLADRLFGERTSYVIEKGSGPCFYQINLPLDFRLIEKYIGYINLGTNDYVVFHGAKPCYVESNNYWGMSDNLDFPLEKYLYLGYDVDGSEYAYELDGPKVNRLVTWSWFNENSNESDIKEYSGDFLNILEEKIYSYLK
jgi:hypothetical protein